MRLHDATDADFGWLLLCALFAGLFLCGLCALLNSIRLYCRGNGLGPAPPMLKLEARWRRGWTAADDLLRRVQWKWALYGGVGAVRDYLSANPPE